MNMLPEEFKWFAALREKMSHGKPTLEEKNEFMEFMYRKGELEQEYYDDYLTGRNADKVFGMAVLRGGIAVFGYWVDNIFPKYKKAIFPQ